MNTKEWSVERIMFAFGGSLTVFFSILAISVYPIFVYGALFVGCMFLIFAITGYCPSAIIVDKMMKK